MQNLAVTPRQMEALSRYRKGMRKCDIGRELGISPKAVAVMIKRGEYYESKAAQERRNFVHGDP
jgi:DNA-binding CsgD family transcriptional regulator